MYGVRNLNGRRQVAMYEKGLRDYQQGLDPELPA